MNNFLGQFGEIYQHSMVDNGIAAPQTTIATSTSFTSNPTQGRNFIGGSPHRQIMESLPTNPMMSLSNLSNFDSNDRNLRMSIENMMNLSVQKMRGGDLSAEESLPSKRSRTGGVSFVKSPHTNRTNYEEAKQWLQNTDRDTADFLNYLEKFQKENVKPEIENRLN